MELNNMEMTSNNMDLNKQYSISEIIENKQLMSKLLHRAIAMEMTEENVEKLTEFVIGCQKEMLEFQTKKSTDDPDYNRVDHLITPANRASKISDDILTIMANKLPEEKFEAVSQFIRESIDSYAQSKANQSFHVAK